MPDLSQELPDSADVVIVGGGLVGACLAIALESLPLRVVMLEAHAGTSMPAVFDQRNLSFNMATVNALNALGILPLLEAPSGSIRTIETSRVGDFGRVLMRASDYGRPEFGRVVIASDFGRALESRLSSVGNLERIRPASFLSSSLEGESRTVTFTSPSGTHRLRAPLLVGADGAQSAVRASLGIDASTYEYGHQLFVAAGRLSRPLNGQAYERLSDEGPIALLPRGDGLVGVVLGVRNDDADRVASLSDDEYAVYVQTRFGFRAGKFSSFGPRSRYPGVRMIADSVIAPHAVLIGNAAQSLHPVGAQGFNLGLRDALTLAESLESLETYATRRAEDRARTVQMSHQMASLGTRSDLPTRLLRETAMVLSGRVRSVQSELVARAMGLAGDVPRLCRDPL